MKSLFFKGYLGIWKDMLFTTTAESLVFVSEESQDEYVYKYTSSFRGSNCLCLLTTLKPTQARNIIVANNGALKICKSQLVVVVVIFSISLSTCMKKRNSV